MNEGTLILYAIYIFMLAVFVGFEVISKVPVQLHTPLMSGTNAIHGIVMLGGMLVLAEAHGRGCSRGSASWRWCWAR